MPRNVWEIEINSETSREDLERCSIAAEHTSDPNVQRVAAKARAELWRREQEVWAARFNAQSEERIHAQRFQEGQITRQLEAQKNLTAQQTEIAKEQAKAARVSAGATSVLVILTAILASVAAISLYQAINEKPGLLNHPPAETTPLEK